jgi:hypothetical protein
VDGEHTFSMLTFTWGWAEGDWLDGAASGSCWAASGEAKAERPIQRTKIGILGTPEF